MKGCSVNWSAITSNVMAIMLNMGSSIRNVGDFQECS